MPPKAKPETTENVANTDAASTTPRTAPKHGSLGAALAAFQAEMPSVFKGKTAKVPTKAGGSYCLGPATKVLTADLLWVPISKVQVGDKLAGFDEYPDPTRPSSRRWRTATVEAVGVERLPSYRIRLSDHTVIDASETHRWLSVDEKGVTRWIDTKDLRPANGTTARGGAYKYPTHVKRVTHRPWGMPPVEYDAYMIGYLAAAFDGEGSLVQTPIVRDEREDTYQLHCTFAQRRNAMYEKVARYLTSLQVPFKESETGGGTNGDVHHIRIAGGRAEVMQFLGAVRPQRLLDHFSVDSLGALRTLDRVRVESVEYLGETEVISTQTSTRTLIAEGIASHNSYQYADIADVTAAAKPILSRHGLAFTCLPRSTATGYELVGRLVYGSEYIEGALPLFGHTNQEIGSAITYSRRYLLGCLTGIVTDDDEDGNVARDTGGQRTTQRRANADLNSPDVSAILAQLAESITVDDVRELWNQYSIGNAPQNVQNEFHKRVDVLNQAAQARAQQRVSDAMGGHDPQDGTETYVDQP
jgi:hypothetical protein